MLELENYLFSGFADQAQAALPAIRSALAGYGGEIVLSGPFIDLNPGSPERLNLEATRTRFEQAHAFALAVDGREIIYLSTFIPIIYLAAYEQDWGARSIAFWRSYMDTVDPGVTISLGNTFEFHPRYLVQIANGVNRPNFKLAFDIGHFLVYSRVELAQWLGAVGPYCSTGYVHSNNGQIDTHQPPGSGVLRAEQIAQVAGAVPPQTRFILKMADKQSLGASVDWLRRALGA